jgi:hypothetical protein
MATARFITLFVICGTAVSSAQADQKSAVDNAKARLDAARKVYQFMTESLKVTASAEPRPLEPERFYLWSRRWMEAQREVSDKKEDQIGAVKAHVGRMKELEEILQKLYDTEQIDSASVLAAGFYRLEAEKWLSEAKTK